MQLPAPAKQLARLYFGLARPPTQLHQAPSPLQRCAPSRLSTISGAAEPKSLSRPASSSLDRPQYPLSEPADHLRQTGASFRTRGGEARAYGLISLETQSPLALSLTNGEMKPTKIAPHLQVIARSRVRANQSSSDTSKPLFLLCTCSVSAKIS